MYDELIKNLRICSRCDFGQDCNGCTQKSDDAFCCDKLLHQAADAIEDLENRLNLWRHGKIKTEDNCDNPLVNDTNSSNEPIWHGRWETFYPPDEPVPFWRCSVCTEECVYHANYCPNCGADMREES